MLDQLELLRVHGEESLRIEAHANPSCLTKPCMHGGNDRNVGLTADTSLQAPMGRVKPPQALHKEAACQDHVGQYIWLSGQLQHCQLLGVYYLHDSSIPVESALQPVSLSLTIASAQ